MYVPNSARSEDIIITVDILNSVYTRTKFNPIFEKGFELLFCIAVLH